MQPVSRRPCAVIALAFALSLAGSPAAATTTTLQGRVVDGSSAPIPGATVFIYTAQPRIGLGSTCPSCYPECGKSATTDHKGRFAVPAVDDRLLYRLLVVAPGKVPTFAERVDPATGPVLTTLTTRDTTAVPGLRVLVGHVVSERGEPVVGASVQPRGITTEGGRTSFGDLVRMNARIESIAITDADGTFRLSGPDSILSWVLLVRARDHSPKVFPDVEPRTQGALLKLERGAIVTGSVTHDGLPVAGGGVALTMIDRTAFSYAPTDSIATDENGRFTFVNVPASQDYALSSVIGSMGPWTVRTVVRTVGENDSTTVLPAISVERGYRLKGRVVTTDGTPVPEGTQLTLGRTLLSNSTTLPLGPDGAFELDGLPPETIVLMARLKGFHVSPRSRGYVGRFLPGVRIAMLRDQLDVQIVLEPDTADTGPDSGRP